MNENRWIIDEAIEWIEFVKKIDLAPLRWELGSVIVFRLMVMGAVDTITIKSAENTEISVENLFFGIPAEINHSEPLLIKLVTQD